MSRILFFITISLIFLVSTVVQADLLEGLVLYMTFEGQGDAVVDLSPEGNDGVIHGAERVASKEGFGQALEFSPGDYVEIPHSESLNMADAITVMGWTNMRPGGSGEMAIVSKGQWAAHDLPYELTVTPGGVIYWQFFDDAGRDSCSPPSPPVGEWHHIAGTYDSKTFVCYVDGEEKQRWDYAGEIPQNTANVTIGKRSKKDDTFFDGLIDEVAIYHRALEGAEIQAAMEGIPASVEPSGKLATLWANLKIQP